MSPQDSLKNFEQHKPYAIIMNNRILTLVCCLALSRIGFANPNFAADYIARYQDLAVREMQRTGIPASITLAQGMFESQYGQSDLARNANNHFGIKCKSDWIGETYTQHDDKPDECFKKYNTAYESYIDHSDLLKSRQWYNFLFLLDPTDYKAWAAGLLKAGYATDPQYADKLIEVIERYQLQLTDKTTPTPTPVIFAQTISFDKNNESALQEHHNTRLRGHNPTATNTSPTRKATETPTLSPDYQQQDNNKSNDDDESAIGEPLSSNQPTRKPQRSTESPEMGIAAIETAFSQAAANRPDRTERQNLTGAPAIAINSNEMRAANVQPRRPATTHQTVPATPRQPAETRPTANDIDHNYDDNANVVVYNPNETSSPQVAYYESAPNNDGNNNSNNQAEPTNNSPTTTIPNPEPAKTQTSYTAFDSHLANTNDAAALQYVSNQSTNETATQSYYPVVQTADAAPTIVLATYHQPANEPNLVPAAAPQAASTEPKQTIVNDRRAIIYPYDLSLNEVATKQKIDINLLKDYNKELSPKQKIARGTTIFLQAPMYGK